MKKTIKIFSVLMPIMVLLSAQGAFAQSEAVKKAVQDVKQSVDTLVIARDENVTSDLGLRIEALKKVIELSMSEAKELRVKLALLETEDELKIWREEVSNRLGEVLSYLDQKQKLSTSGDIKNIEALKEVAQTFKDWRDATYTPLAEEIDEFFAVKKGDEVIKVASARSLKIAKDIIKIQKINPKAALSLKASLQKADRLISDGASVQKNSFNVFYGKYVLPIVVTSTPVTTTSSLSIVIGTSTIGIGTSTMIKMRMVESDGLKPFESEEVPIKDLIRASFQKVRDAYQVFIEMSSSVREFTL